MGSDFKERDSSDIEKKNLNEWQPRRNLVVCLKITKIEIK